jgi:hypothetical protein
MNKNMFDPNTFKNLENMMKGFGDMTSKPMIDTKIIKKLIIIVGLIVFLSGVSIGILIGLMF